MFVLPGWFVNNNVMSLDSVTKFVSVLAMIAIVSMDLNVPYNDTEKAVYSHSIFQLLVIFSVSYQNLNNLNFALVVAAAWAILKHYKNIRSVITRTENFDYDNISRVPKCSVARKFEEEKGNTGTIWCSGSGGFCNTCPEDERQERSGTGQFYYGEANNSDNSIECRYRGDRRLFDERCN